MRRRKRRFAATAAMMMFIAVMIGGTSLCISRALTMLHNSQSISESRETIQGLTIDLQHLQIQLTAKENLNRISDMAAALGMDEYQPSQILMVIPVSSGVSTVVQAVDGPDAG